jgi:hypothetical protein
MSCRLSSSVTLLEKATLADDLSKGTNNSTDEYMEKIFYAQISFYFVAQDPYVLSRESEVLLSKNK